MVEAILLQVYKGCRMTRAKQKSLLFLAVAGVLTLILAMTVSNIVLSPGQPFLFEPTVSETAGSGGVLPGGAVLMRLFQGILALAILLFPVYVIYSLMSAGGRRRLVAQVVLMMILLLVADSLADIPPEEEVDPPQALIGGASDLRRGGGSSLGDSIPAEPPPGFTLIVVLLVSVLAVAIVGAIIWQVRQRIEKPDFAFAKLAEEARNAIVSIHAGDDFGAAIIRCYQEMSRVLGEETGITRETFMTPREFENRLISKGFSQESLRTLTRLFEQVRYSSIPAGTHEKDRAVACLTDIVDACKAMGVRHE
jgi:hypothetical protein